MSVLVYIDHANGVIKKSAFEAMSYGAAVAKQLGTQATALFLGSPSTDLSALGNYGIDKVYHANNTAFHTVDAKVLTAAINEAANQIAAQVLIFSQNQTGKTLAAAVSAKLKAGLVAGACALPETTNGFTVKKTVFSGKAYANVAIKSAVKVISINVNSYSVVTTGGSANVESINITPIAASVNITNVNKLEGQLPLTEAEVVVSGGRGLKGPENWGILLDLATELNAATACSRPVGDAHWRPHHEHVGQTGVQVAPNLYIAIGISGAIQHLAGVNRSKVIVVINKDPEAPFFKAADYGIVGDAFEVVPKLTAAIKKLKTSA